MAALALLLGQGRAVAVTQPGAGMNPAAIKPFDKSHSDGFSLTACVKDSMHLYGDKFGDGKFDYKLGDVSNVSIVNYEAHIKKEDREAMTQPVCFAFCRTIPHMKFFGLTHGRDCYCTPFFKQIASDSSECDAVCEGNPTTMCGGMSKSSVFEMHACNDAAANLQEASTAAAAVRAQLKDVADAVATASSDMQSAADTLQPAFGKVGDVAAGASLQSAKEFAGTLEHAAEKGQAVITEIEALEAKGAAKDVQGSEAHTAALQAAASRATAQNETLAALNAKAAPTSKDNGASKLYYPIMYFVDKNFTDAPSTCGGSAAADPIVGTHDACAEACEAAVGKCVGFGYFASGSLCFLFSEFKSVTYYTGCPEAASPAPKGKKFLQSVASQAKDKASAAAADTKCVAKFADFEGANLTPDPSGKCKGCLKEASKAARCFQ